MKHIAAMGAFALATLVAPARDITSLTLAQSGDDLTANVAFTAGETDDNHTLYLAYGPSDLGNTLYAWANGGVITNCGAVADNATSATVTLSGTAKTGAFYRAFLVKSTGVTPAYTGRLVEAIRTGANPDEKTWIATDWFCTGNEAITAVFKGLTGDNARPFGSRSSSSNASRFEVYNYRNTRWGYLYAGGSTNRTGIAYSSKKTVLTLDAKNKKLSATSEDKGTATYDITEPLLAEGAEKSNYPLSIFATSMNSSGSSVYYATSNSVLYLCHILTNDQAYARYYIPAVSDNKVGLWDAVENTVRFPRSTSSPFYATDFDGNDYAEADFHAAVPAELQTKYETIVSTSSAIAHPAREITGLAVVKDRATGIVSATVSFTSGATGNDDILYIAWGDSDMGNTLAAWSTNVFCAGAVAADAQSASVTLPQGKYPCYFRAFLMNPNGLDCDSFAEYLLSDGTSYIQSDWYPTKGDKFAMHFSYGSTAAAQRPFGGGNTDGSGSLVEIYTRSSDTHGYGSAIYYQGGVKYEFDDTPVTIYTSIQDLYYDSGTDTMTVSYPDKEETYSSGFFLSGKEYPDLNTTPSTQSSKPIHIFATSRNTSLAPVLSGAKFYSMSISNVVDSVPTLARHYVAAVKNGTYGVWDAVQDKFIAPPSGHLFCATNATGGVIGELPFSSAVPQELQRQYLVKTDSRLAYLPMEGTIISIR